MLTVPPVHQAHLVQEALLVPVVPVVCKESMILMLPSVQDALVVHLAHQAQEAHSDPMLPMVSTVSTIQVLPSVLDALLVHLVHQAQEAPLVLKALMVPLDPMLQMV